MYCHQCGKEVGEASFCQYCGASLNGTQQTQQTYQQQTYQQQTYQQPLPNARLDDEPSAGFAVLSFFIPVVGLVLYLVWNKDYPKKAKSCLKGFIANIVFYVVITCCMFAFIFGILANENSYNNRYNNDYYSDYDYDFDEGFFNGNFNAVIEGID